MQLIKIANIQPNHEFVSVFAITLKHEGFTDSFFIEKLPANGRIKLETVIDKMMQNSIDFSRYRVDPSEAEDTPS